MIEFSKYEPTTLDKQRPIDDRAKLFHNAATAFDETIECCTAWQPATRLKPFVCEATLAGIPRTELCNMSMETGGGGHAGGIQVGAC